MDIFIRVTKNNSENQCSEVSECKFFFYGDTYSILNKWFHTTLVSYTRFFVAIFSAYFSNFKFKVLLFYMIKETNTLLNIIKICVSRILLQYILSYLRRPRCNCRTNYQLQLTRTYTMILFQSLAVIKMYCICNSLCYLVLYLFQCTY